MSMTDKAKDKSLELHMALFAKCRNKNPALANVNIATVGPKGAGKDTLGNILIKHAPYDHRNFADLLKEVCYLKYGLTYGECHDPQLKEKVLDRWPYVTPRQLMQDEAETSRKLYPDIWVKAWEMQLEEWDDYSLNLLVTDLRYPNELEAFRKLPNNFIIYVYNPDVEEARKQGRAIKDPRWTHESESHTPLLKAVADLMVVNSQRTLGSLEEALFYSLHLS